MNNNCCNSNCNVNYPPIIPPPCHFCPQAITGPTGATGPTGPSKISSAYLVSFNNYP